MKRKLLTLALGIAAMLAGCQKEDSAGVMNPENSKATFRVAVDNGAQTRATEPANAPTRYIMEVYELETEGAAVSGAPLQQLKVSTGSFDVTLKEGTHYACLFWADYGGDDYVVTDLKAVKVGTQAKNMAFGGSVRFTYDSQATDKTYLTPTLTHSVAQVNFVQTEDFTTADNTLSVTFPKTYTLNLDNNLEELIDSPATYTFANIAKGSKDATIGTCYIIVADGAQTVLDITTTFNGEVEKTITNVPFQRNHKTNITGAYSNLYETALSVTCDDAWETPENEEIFPRPKVGDYYYKNGTWSTELKETTENPVIGVIYKVNSDSKTGSVVSLNEPTGAWAKSNMNATGATSNTDGKANTAMVFKYFLETVDDTDFPIFKACYQQRTATGNDGWYIPAKYNDFFQNESAVANAINSKLTAASGVALAVPTGDSNGYWTSMEIESYSAFLQNSATVQNNANKLNEHKVRFVLDF